MRRSSSSSSYSSSVSVDEKRLVVNNLTGNVNENHLQEIFGTFGDINNVDLLTKECKFGELKRGIAYIDFEYASDADEAEIYMNGG